MEQFHGTTIISVRRKTATGGGRNGQRRAQRNAVFRKALRPHLIAGQPDGDVATVRRAGHGMPDLEVAVADLDRRPQRRDP